MTPGTLAYQRTRDADEVDSVFRVATATGDLPVDHVKIAIRATRVSEARHTARAPHAPRRFRLPVGWPLIAVFVGMPLWWILGLVQVICFAASIPMAAHLLRQRPVVAPRGFAIWLLFLIWIAAGVLVLQVDAPGAIPGASLMRYPTFGFRMGWYLTGTIALLYIANTRHALAQSRVASLLATGFLVVTAGGWLGLLAPTFNFTTPLEMALPRSIASNPFVYGMVHAQAAQLHDFLGYVQPRPSAPFFYTNAWGLVMALTIPFFVAEYGRRAGRWRWFTAVGLILAIVPIIASLNRGLWLALAAMAVVAALRSVLLGNLRLLGLLLAGGAVTLALVVGTPLGNLVADRFENQHSNEGRGNLGALAVSSALEGSPVIGFGTTRDVEGNFSSIAGGATAACPNCSPPPLGTQGQLWLLIFAGGIGALALYLSFFAYQFWRHWRDSGPYALAGLCSIAAMFVTMPFYDSVGFGVFVALIAIGLLERCRPPDGRSFSDLVGPLRRNLPLVLVVTICGLGIGGALGMRNAQPASASQSVLLPFDDLVGVPGTRPISLDSEALLATSAPVLRAVSERVGLEDWRDAGDGLSVTAEPNTRILNLQYQAADGATARAAIETAVDSYLDVRRQMINDAQNSLSVRLEQRGQQLLTIYTDLQQVSQLGTGGPSLTQGSTAEEVRAEAQRVSTQLVALQTPQGSPGEVIAAVRVERSNDGLVIAIASGGVIGFMAGLLIAYLIDGNLRLTPRRGARTHKPVLQDLVALPSTALGAANRYAPLAGAISDESFDACRSLAKDIEGHLVANATLSGRRVVLVVSPHSTPRQLRRLRLSCRRRGLEPVGIVLTADERVPAGRLR